MTPAVDVASLPPRLVAELVARASRPDCDRWEDQVRRAGYCSRPVRLSGHVSTVDPATGAYRQRYTTLGEPDGCLLKACGQRRASICEGCSVVYQGDAFALLAAGLRGGKGIPESVAGHPTLFVTFTAPGFGPVHARRERGGRVERCRPRRDETCPHGVKLDCRVRHRDDDGELGEPLCPDCFDYAGAVLWNALAPELWRRTTVYLRRALARLAGLTNAHLGQLVRLSYAKVVEYQRRGLVHFHAVVRLDAAPPAGDPRAVEPPAAPFTAELLEQALRAAAAAVSAPSPAGGVVRWGRQLDVRAIAEAVAGSFSRGAVAGYVAKYATKSTDPLGRLDHRIGSLGELDARGVTGHVRRLVEAAWNLGADERLAELGLRRWAHTLGFGGHWMTKSRRYSTTFGALRRARATWAAEHDETADQGDADDQADVQVISQWEFVGVGYETAGDRLLAVSAGRWAREQRRIAREELGTAA